MGGGQIAAKFLGVRPQGERRVSQLNLHCGLCGWMWSPARYPMSLDQLEERKNQPCVKCGSTDVMIFEERIGLDV